MSACLSIMLKQDILITAGLFLDFYESSGCRHTCLIIYEYVITYLYTKGHRYLTNDVSQIHSSYISCVKFIFIYVYEEIYFCFPYFVCRPLKTSAPLPLFLL